MYRQQQEESQGIWNHSNCSTQTVMQSEPSSLRRVLHNTLLPCKLQLQSLQARAPNYLTTSYYLLANRKRASQQQQQQQQQHHHHHETDGTERSTPKNNLELTAAPVSGPVTPKKHINAFQAEGKVCVQRGQLALISCALDCLRIL